MVQKKLLSFEFSDSLGQSLAIMSTKAESGGAYFKLSELDLKGMILLCIRI